MKWFGESWGAPICVDTDHVATPVGKPCTHCEELIAAGDQGILVPSIDEQAEYAYHNECFLRGIIGSVGHQKHICHCNGGDEEDPPGMTRRQAARAACEYFWSHRSEPMKPIVVVDLTLDEADLPPE